MIAFFDASALIYVIEAREPFASTLRQALTALAELHPGMPVALSRLTWLECRISPLKGGDAVTLARYDTFFARPDLIWVELGRDVVELATAVRARHGLRTPDALQAACCLQLGPEHLLLTGDTAFTRVSGLRVRVLA